MKVIKLLIFSGLAVLSTFTLTSCQGARFVTAKVKVVEAANIGNRGDFVRILLDENLSPADQSKADQLRQNTQAFYAEREKDLEVYGDHRGDLTVNLLAVSQPLTSSSFPLPVEIHIFTDAPHRAGQSTDHGYAEIRFGDSGPVYVTNINEGYFQFEISSVYNENGDDIATGKFSLIARNKDDNTDTKRLVVMDGAFMTRIK